MIYTRIGSFLIRNYFRLISFFTLPASLLNSKKAVFFIGYPRSGHTLISSIIDANENAYLAHEANVFEKEWCLKKKFLLINEIHTHRILFNKYLKKKWGDYDYNFNGVKTKKEISLIGDKKGGNTLRICLKKKCFFNKINVYTSYYFNQVYWIHVVRNPKNMLTTRYQKNKKLEKFDNLDELILLFKKEVTYMNQLIENGNYNIITLYYEDLTKKPEKFIEELFLCLKINVDKNQIFSISRSIKTFPDRFNKVSWSHENIEALNLICKEIDFLNRYYLKN